MAQAYCGTRISPHMIRDVNGFLVCLSAPICRSGYQTYRANEVDPQSGDDTELDILRPVSEVTSAATIASGEGAVITLRHPSKFVTPETYSWSGLGHAQNIRIGPNDKDGNVQLIADLHIKDKSLIEAIERGVRDLSCGYTYSLIQLSDGTWAQTDIKINHIAVVEDGRAGTSKIMDSKDGDEVDGKKLDRLCDLLEKLLPAQSQSAECNCGAKSQHSDNCPCYGQEAEDVEPWEEAKKSAKPSESDDDDDNKNSSEFGSLETIGAIAGAAALLDSDDPESQYEKAAGPQRKLKGFTGLIPVTGSGAEGNVNPVAARDALQKLRSIRGLVQSKGTDAEIREFNAALRAVKAQIKAGGGGRAVATDARVTRRADAADFERRAASFHGHAIKLHADVNAVEDVHRGEDASRREETFDQAVERVRQEQIERFTPKRRR
jgi:hypothetical protein